MFEAVRRLFREERCQVLHLMGSVARLCPLFFCVVGCGCVVLSPVLVPVLLSSWCFDDYSCDCILAVGPLVVVPVWGSTVAGVSVGWAGV
ncbi:hypothetical protein Pyrfu_0416 [Pyrolobus fumarii 1A]|uniref:Uncharacterized protein n=1 Tax=Pyrolobus fumarii (strain DSM 11204 / 1A) TaxID=694429 RepID=G0EG39_PYRF1|nr:hypothetical protein Pyrfu_0416 [Pyrolobus fumarii 1A]